MSNSKRHSDGQGRHARRPSHGTNRLSAVGALATRALALLAALILLPAGTVEARAQTAQTLTSGGQPPGTPSSGLGGLGAATFLPVEEAYHLSVDTDGDRALRLTWRMPPGYYLYQHAFRFTLERDGSSVATTAEYPPALTREDEYFGRVEVYYDDADIRLSATAPVRGATLTVVSQGCADAGLCYPPRTQRFAIDDGGVITELATGTPQRGAAGDPGAETVPPATLWVMLLFAFAGGLILNLMPCVLPVLSLKVLGFASAAPEDRHHHGLLYSAGVVLSFLAVALVLISLRGAGQAIGWGFQLQSPGIVIALAYLFVVLGLAMSGVIELGGRFMNLGSDLAGRGGAAGSFFTGVLAVLVASPCTAPFMGTALGYALVQPAFIGLAVFAALGCGMAAPMLLLAYSEAARRHMPRPGPWMERLKQGLAFPLYATALWLFWVAGRQTGIDVMAVALLGALFLALGIWLWRGRSVARIAAVASVAVAVALAGWRPPAGTAGDDPALPEGSIAYSPARLAGLRAAGRPVFVDVTADWCITCLANERAVLGAESVQQAFRDSGVAYMVADWTDYDPQIADFVASHGRSGIPLYVLYRGDAEPRVLPQILRRGTVIEALEAAAMARVAAANAR